NEAEVVAFAWSVPWERARRERILHVQTHPDHVLRAGWLSELHLKRYWRTGRGDTEGRDVRGLAHRRFAVLQVALRLYQLDRGRPAPDLSALVPAYLPAVPPDPYTGAPFGYRLSEGETLEPLSGRVAPTPAQLYRTSAAVVAALAFPAGGMRW